MAKISRLAGATSQSVNIFIQDSSQTNGAGLTGLVFNTSSLVAYYAFTGANGGSNVITLATLAAANSAYSSGGFKEIDATNMPGLYRLDIPNAALAAAKGNVVTIMLKGATNMAPVLLEIELTAVDNQSTAFGLSIAKTTNITGFNDITAAAAATGVWQDTTAGDFTVASSIGKSLYTSGNVPGASNGLLISGSNAGTTTFGALTCTGSMTISDGLLVSRSTGNTSAITATGNGTGSGIVATSGAGATGDGFQATSNATNGNGLNATGKGTGIGLLATAGATGNGVKAVGGSTSGDAILTSATSGHGATFAGTGTTKHGINATGGATTSNGITATGGGTGSGIVATSGAGATGDGIQATAASTNGNGLKATGIGTGAGTLTTAGLTGNGLQIVGGGTSGDGLKVTTSGGHAANFAGTGTTKHGILATGGATTSDGIHAVGGGVGNGITAISGTGATGDGIAATAASTNGNGMNLTGVGTGDGLAATGGASAGGDGIGAIAGGGVPIRGNITGNITGNISGSVGSVTAAVSITSNVKKNQALNAFTFLMTNSSSHTPQTGLTVTAQVALDGAALVPCTNAVTELSNGLYTINLAAADLNANVAALRFTATAADDQDIIIVTQP